MAAGHPGQRLFEDALRQVAARLLAMPAPTYRALLDHIDELALALLYVRRLIAEPIEGLRRRVEGNLHLHRHRHQLERQVGHAEEWTKLLEAQVERVAAGPQLHAACAARAIHRLGGVRDR